MTECWWGAPLGARAAPGPNSKVCRRDGIGRDCAALRSGFDNIRGILAASTVATFLRLPPQMSTPASHIEPMNCVERWIGRAAAIWVHPVGAWRVPSTRVRLVLIFGYVATGYLVGIVSAFFLAAPVF
jgi:hypothetical protein